MVTYTNRTFIRTNPNRSDRFMRFGLRSVTGNYREMNEDRCYVDATSGLFLVADGMGGHQGGAEASRIVAGVLADQICATISTNLRRESLESTVRCAVQAARDEMIKIADQNAGFSKMGSTLALALISDEKLYFTHLGDSRVYLLRDGIIRRLTSDHSVVQAFVDAGAITSEQARNHPYRNCILNFIGVKPPGKPPVVSTVSLMAGDRILLATDGLTDVVDDETLHQIIMSHSSPQAAADALVGAALKLDSKDNVSCVVVEL